MGNDVASSTINWTDLSRACEKCEISDDADILARLNMQMHASESKDNDEQKANDESIDLEALSDDDLNRLFFRFGVNPDFDDKASKTDKISALKLIASKNFWRINWKLHPLSKRVKNWLFVHEKYRATVADIVKKASTDLDAAKNALKLAGHSDFEDNMLFKFMEENITQAALQNALKELHGDHADELPKMTENMIKCTDLKEFEGLSKEYEAKTLQHLEKEEQNIIHVWLNLNEEQYKTYRAGLSWKYSAVY